MIQVDKQIGSLQKSENKSAAYICPLDEADPEALEKRLRQEFNVFAKQNSVGENVLTYEALQTLSLWLATELDVDPAIFGEMSQMFWRFDFFGDGLLREADALQLMLCMMRSYRDAKQPPPPGSVRLGGKIQYKCVHDEFTIQQKVGEGGQGTVYLCKTRNGVSSWFGGSKEVVLKMFDKSNPSAPVEDITREFELLMEIRHPLIAHVFEIFQDAANIYVVQEPYFGGDLTTAIQSAADVGVRVTECWLGRILKQVLTGVAFLHSRMVIHCDLKEPNVMIAGKSDWQAPQIVVIDFGLANKFATRSRPGGSPGYMPPEVWESGLWTPRGDVFSIGVMMFSMRSGQHPFTDGCQTLEEVKERTQYYLPQLVESSPEFFSLVTQMLEKDFKLRPNILQVLEDPWFLMTESNAQQFNAKVLVSLAKRREKTDLKKALLADLASRGNLAQMKELNELFLQLDVNKDGFVSASDLHQALEGKWTPQQIAALEQGLLGGREGEVSYEEFMGQLIGIREPYENELLWRIFVEVDTHRKGYLDQNDIKALLERPAVAKLLGDRDPLTVMRQMSKSGTTRISFDDFKLAVQGHSEYSNDFGIGNLRRRFRFGPLMYSWQADEVAEYYSVVHRSWLNCRIVAVDNSSGAVQIDIKPGYWLHGVELWTRLRKAPDGNLSSWFWQIASCTSRVCGRG